MTTRWPKPEFSLNNEPHFFFIITPPYSGSTALSALLNTSNRSTFLEDSAEGQWLVPGLCENNRWNKRKLVNYESIKAIWLNRFQKIQKLNPNIDIVIEKSPPNMVRIKELANHFHRHSFLANNRDPYANCASILYRNYDAENIDNNQRIRILKNLTKDWITRSKIIKDLVLELKIPLITYEEFCHSPSLLATKLVLPKGVTETINFNSKVKVKDYKLQKIINQNKRQVSNLNQSEINQLATILNTEKELLNFFGY